MIDEDDVEIFALFGPGGIFGLIVLIILIFVCNGNEKECEKKRCPAPMVSTLQNNRCECIMEAK